MRARDLAAALFVAVVAAGLVVKPWMFLRRGLYRGQVLALYEGLQPGMTKEQVTRVMDSGKFPHLDFDRRGQTWSGSAPLEFGAQSWVLVTEFQGDRVSALRIRTHDGDASQHHPTQAPPDKSG